MTAKWNFHESLQNQITYLLFHLSPEKKGHTDLYLHV